MCTTTDEPSQIVPMLKRKDETSTVLKGHFRLFGDSVNIVATRLQKNSSEPRHRRRNRQVIVQEQVFHMVSVLYCFLTAVTLFLVVFYSTLMRKISLLLLCWFFASLLIRIVVATFSLRSQINFRVLFCVFCSLFIIHLYNGRELYVFSNYLVYYYLC